MKRFFLSVLTILLVSVMAVSVLFFVDRLQEGLPKDFTFDVPSFQALRNDLPTISDIEKKVEQVITDPPPLRIPFKPENIAVLTRVGVIAETNDQRVQYGLPLLKENATLNRAAELKMADLFAKQYFEHVSPEGFGPSHWVEEAGYRYRVIGENLALGDFASDADLVGAWMNSPGHRENILKSAFEEIGVAVGKGTYEGQTTWIGVQVFGTALPNCDAPNEALRAQIDQNQSALNALRAQLEALHNDAEERAGRKPRMTEQQYQEYNRLVEEYNALLKTVREQVSTYNAQVNAYNACIAG